MSWSACRRARSDFTASQPIGDASACDLLEPHEPPQHELAEKLDARRPSVVHEQPAPHPHASASTPLIGAPIAVPNGSTRTHRPDVAASSALPTVQPASVVSGS